MDGFVVVSTISQLEDVDETGGVPERVITVTIEPASGLVKPAAPVVIALPPPKRPTLAPVVTASPPVSELSNPPLKPRTSAPIALQRESVSSPPKRLNLSEVVADEYAPEAVISEEEEEEEEEDHFDSPVPSAPDSPDPARDEDNLPPRKAAFPVLQTISAVQIDVPPKRRQIPRAAPKAADRPSRKFSRAPVPESSRPAPEQVHLLYRPTLGGTKYRSQKPISMSREPVESNNPPKKSSRRRIPTVNDDLPIFHSEDDPDFTKARRFRSRVGPDDLPSTVNLSPIPKRKAGPVDDSGTTGLDEHLTEGPARKRRAIAPKGDQTDTTEFLRVEKEKAKKQSVWMFVPLDRQ
jgi:hypothetical protein